jgi:hypothetical protein
MVGNATRAINIVNKEARINCRYALYYKGRSQSYHQLKELSKALNDIILFPNYC